MSHVKYLLDGSNVRQLRETRKLSQEAFAELADIGMRTLVAVENNERIVTAEIAELIATALETPVDEIGIQVVSWQWVPDLEPGSQRKLSAAIRDDMRGDHNRALKRCRDILVDVEQSGNFRHYAAVFVKLVTFLDHAGEHQQALDELDTFFRRVETERPSCEAEVEWARYHRGVCLRRLQRYDHARRELRQLHDESTQLRQATIYQLAVVDLQQALDSGAAPLPGELLERFQQCHDAWADLKSHRRAYPLRRIGQWHAINGQYRKACECFSDAVEIFARHDCDRYVEATRDDLRVFVLDRLCPA